MDQPDLMSTQVPPGSFEMNAPQYFTTVAPESSHHPAQHEYFAPHPGPPMPPPPPLPEPPGTSNVSLDPMLQQPPPPSQPIPQAQVQGSEAIINAAKAERSAQDRERGRLRVQRFRLKRKLADAEAGRRDKDTLKKIKFPAADAQDNGNNGAGPSTARKAPSAKDTEAELRERERGRLRVQAYRMRKKLAEAKDGIRDATTLKKIRTGKAGESSREAAPPAVAPYPAPIQAPIPPEMLQYPEGMFNVPGETSATMLPPPPLPPQVNIPDPGMPTVDANGSASTTVAQAPSSSPTTATTTSPRQRAVRTNWFHPSRWSTINAAGLRANFSSAHEIVRLAKLAPGGEDTFKTLDRGTVHKWIDKEHGTWSESVLEKVRKAAVKEAESWDNARGEGEPRAGGASGELGGAVPMGVEGAPPSLGDGSGAAGNLEVNAGNGVDPSLGASS